MSDVDLTVRVMKRLGYSDTKILELIAALDAERKASAREANARRQAEWRQRNRRNEHNVNNDVTRDSVIGVTHVTEEPASRADIELHVRADGNPNPLTTFEDNYITPLPTVGPQTSEKPKRASRRSAEPSQPDEVMRILLDAVPAKVASAIVAHRKALKAPLTAGAAEGLVKEWRKFGDCEMAAMAQMAQGWRGFEAEWMQRKARAGPKFERPRNGYAVVHDEICNGTPSDPDEYRVPFGPDTSAAPMARSKNDATRASFPSEVLDLEPIRADRR